VAATQTGPDQTGPDQTGPEHAGPDQAGRPAAKPVRRSVLIRYRVLAWVTGTLLVPLVFVATPLDLWGNTPGPAAVLGFLHGWLYVIYLVFAFELTVRLRLPLPRMLLVLLAGTVPFASFFAERSMTRAWVANQSG
jgi:integral membrane protein